MAFEGEGERLVVVGLREDFGGGDRRVVSEATVSCMLAVDITCSGRGERCEKD